MISPIVGSSYLARSTQAAANRMVNLFPEIIPEGGKTSAYLCRCPGLTELCTAGIGPIRGLWTFGEFGYAVSADKLYKISSTWNATLLGTVTGTGPVSMADNGTQLFVACGTRGYIWNETTDVFAEITDPDFHGADTVGYLDGYFVFNQPDTQTLWVTSLLDGTAVDPLEFASAEGFPDDLLAVVVDHREAWLFGAISTEVWYDSGAADFPLERIQGAVLEVGIASPYCASKLDNTLIWLANDGIVYRANGYTPQRVSTHAVEWWINQNADLSEAQSYAYRQDGHQWYVLTFPSNDTTWVYDAATNAWHERASWYNGTYIRHRSNCYMYFSGTHVVGDYLDNRIHAIDLESYDDSGDDQRWLRAWRALPPNTDDLKRKAHHSLTLDIETGVGLTTGQGDDPQVMLRFSNDGGKTWASELWRTIGAIGETGRRVIWRRLGMTDKLRDRVYEVSGTDPVRIIITGAHLDVEPTRG